MDSEDPPEAETNNETLSNGNGENEPKMTEKVALSNGNGENGLKTMDKVAQSNGNCGNGPKTADKVAQDNGDWESRLAFLEQRRFLNRTMNEESDGEWKAKRSKNWIKAVICSLVVSSIANLLIIVMMLPKSSVPCSTIVVFSCPSEWIGYEGKCYYFSDSEGTWNSSQSNCSTSGASLVTIEDQKEMNFIMRVKEPTDYWIGLKRKEGQPWEWANGTVFNGWFKIGADGPCAYLNDEAASSTLCGTIRNWICDMSARSA